jgi:hypothetical protein
MRKEPAEKETTQTIPTVDAFVRTVLSLTGVPFQHAGRSRAGLDCVGVILCALDEIGVHVDVRPYGRWTREAELVTRLDAQTSAVDANAVRAGDLLLLRASRRLQHIAVLLQADLSHAWIVHSHETVGRVTLERLEGEWRDAVVQIRRIDALENS